MCHSAAKRRSNDIPAKKQPTKCSAVSRFVALSEERFDKLRLVRLTKRAWVQAKKRAIQPEGEPPVLHLLATPRL